MARFLSTLPTNLGFYNLGTVQAYPTGGTGPTAYGPTSYFGSDPLPATAGDSLYNPIDLGDFSPVSKSVTLTASHGGLSRRQNTFYKIKLSKRRAIQFTQLNSTTAYTSNTNKNTLIAIYQLTSDNRREELPFNDLGYECPSSSIDESSDDLYTDDYPTTTLNAGNYIFLITNDIKYVETTYSIGVNVKVNDYRFDEEPTEDSVDYRFVTEAVDETLDYGFLRL